MTESRLLGHQFSPSFAVFFPGLLGSVASLGVEEVVPQSERRRVVPNEVVVVLVVVVCASPYQEEVVQRDRELVARVCVDGLEQPEGNPDADCEQVQVSREVAPDDRNANSAKSQEHDFDRMGVFGSQPERCRVSVVLLVDDSVEGPIVDTSVEPVMPCVLQEEEDRHLQCNLGPRREWNIVGNPNLLTNRMEEPDWQRFHEKV